MLHSVIIFITSITLVLGGSFGKFDYQDEKVQGCIKRTGVSLDASIDYTIHSESSRGTDALCIGKCMMEDDGALNSNGEIQIEKVDQELITPKIEECLKSVPTVKKCTDMNKVMDCFVK